MVGLGIYDDQKFISSKFINNVIFNTQSQTSYLDVSSDSLSEHHLTNDSQFLEVLLSKTSTHLPVYIEDLIYNFSRQKDIEGQLISSPNLYFDMENISPFANQTKYGTVDVDKDSSITITGNGWYKVPVDIDIGANTELSISYEAEGRIEIGGIALETDNKVTQSRVFKFVGVQPYIVFILDNDVNQSNNNSSIKFSNVSITGLHGATPNVSKAGATALKDILVGQ